MSVYVECELFDHVKNIAFFKGLDKPVQPDACAFCTGKECLILTENIQVSVTQNSPSNILVFRKSEHKEEHTLFSPK